MLSIKDLQVSLEDEDKEILKGRQKAIKLLPSNVMSSALDHNGPDIRVSCRDLIGHVG